MCNKHRDCSIHIESAVYTQREYDLKNPQEKWNTLGLYPVRAFQKKAKVFLFSETVLLIQLMLNLGTVNNTGLILSSAYT